MIVRRLTLLLLAMTWTRAAQAQDVPGIEICTVEKTMERRTSCLQSNVDFLQKTIGRLTLDHQRKLDAANLQIEGLKSALATLQKAVTDMQAAAQKDQPPAKGGAVPANNAPVAKGDAAK